MAEDFVVTESAVAVEAAMSEPADIEEPVSHTVAYLNVGYVASVCAHALFSDTMFFQLYLGSCEHNWRDCGSTREDWGWAHRWTYPSANKWSHQGNLLLLNQKKNENKTLPNRWVWFHLLNTKLISWHVIEFQAKEEIVTEVEIETKTVIILILSTSRIDLPKKVIFR